MLPVLFAIGPVKIYSMGVLLAIGLFWGLFYWWKLGRDEHWDEIALFDSFFLGLIAFFIFGRLGYVAMHYTELGTFYRLFAFLAYPGISYLTGIIAAILAALAFGRSRAWESWKILDILAVVLPLILIFGFGGSWLNGSNPGKPVGWGLLYPGVVGKRLPVDLWGIIWAGLTFGMSFMVRKNFRFYAWYKGSASVARDGLAALLGLGSAGVYWLGVSLMDDQLLSFFHVPVVLIIGLLVIIGSALVVYRRIRA